ncbi:mRNA surveillance protein pelota [Candidatus Micrarchaeota archaeon]|nr:mRNA surveillance protein pelota [Candidatus Micrarchaeota archaeon]
MQIRFLDQKTKTIKIVPEILDDLWHLEQIIEPNDLISGSTDRKIKGKDEQQKSERIKLFLKIQVEDAEFHRFSGILRVNGIIVEGKPVHLIDLKAHHSLEINLGEVTTIQKNEWKEHQIQRLKKAVEATQKEPVLLCVLDDETASFGILKEFDVEPRGAIRAAKTGKRFEATDENEKKYLEEISQKIKEISPKKLVVAGPGFTKENLKKHWEKTNQKISETVFFESTNSTGITGLNELVKSGALEKIVQATQIAQDAQKIEGFLKELATESGLSVYGKKEILEAIEMRAVKELLVLDSLLRQDSTIQPLLQKVEQHKGKIHILNSETDPGKKLEGFGGMVGILKFKTKWE